MMNFPYGDITTDIPPNFAPPEMWPETAPICMPVTMCLREEVGKKPKGVRWSFWPITFEQYVGDDEPDLEAAGGSINRFRFVVWKRNFRKDTPKGWTILSRGPWRIDGFFKLETGEEYTKLWYKQARRDLRLWEEQFADKTHAIEPISLQEYKAAFAKSTVRKKAGYAAVEMLERRYHYPASKEHMELWGIRDKATQKIVAGIALRYSPTYQSTTYECPFILPEARRIYAATALIDLWFKESLKHGYKLLVMNSFWQPGEPKSWKAFSLFKSHFGPRYVAYPPALWKFRGGKIF